MNNMQDCADPNIPKVDNTALECTEIVSTDCVATSEAQPYLRYGSNTLITKVFSLIAQAIKRIDQSLADYLTPYKSYTVKLYQVDLAAPSEAALFDNRLSLTPTYTRVDSGEYTLTSVGAFPATKTKIIQPNSRVDISAGIVTSVYEVFAERVNDDTITIKTTQKSGVVPTLSDNLLDGINTVLEIRVYK